MTLLAKIEGGAIAAYPYSAAELRADHPETCFPADLSAVDLAEFGAAVVTPTERPEPSEGKVVEEAGPQLAEGVWVQAWAERDMTPEELAALVPQVVSMRQARLALLGAGLLSAVEAAIGQLPEAAQIEWEYATEVRRDHALIAALADELELSAGQIDALFIAAAAL